ncbi:MAG: NAD(P)-dependent oxidoreductase [Gammaproteobacteria bacterium]
MRDGAIEAVGLDVTEVEPVNAQDPLLVLPNCIVTPHIAGFSPTFLNECPVRQAENVLRVLNGDASHNSRPLEGRARSFHRPRAAGWHREATPATSPERLTSAALSLLERHDDAGREDLADWCMLSQAKGSQINPFMDTAGRL